MAKIDSAPQLPVTADDDATPRPPASGWVAWAMAILDRRPLVFNVVAITLVFPLASATVLLEPILAAAVGRQGLVFAAAFEAIRRSCEWVAAWFTSFFYVQLGNLSRVEGSAQDLAVAAHLVIGTMASLGFGVLSMVFLWAVGKSLLFAYTPAVYANRSVLVDVGLTAQSILAAYTIARISLSMFSGITLAQSAQNVLLVVPAFLGAILALTLGVLLMVPALNASPCEQCALAANATAHRLALVASGRAASEPLEPLAAAARAACVDATGGAAGFDAAVSAAMRGEAVFNHINWVCPGASRLLETTAVYEVVGEATGASLLLAFCYAIACRRGYFRQHGCRLRAYVCEAREFDTRDRAAARSFATKNFGVFVRSITGNSRVYPTRSVEPRLGRVAWVRVEADLLTY